MLGYLVYQREDAVRNATFIRLFYEEGKAAHILFRYVPYEKYKKKALPDFILNRTRDATVSQWYEGHKVPVLHSSGITGIGNNKWKTLRYLQARLPAEIIKGKWMPDSCAVSSKVIGRWLDAAGVHDYSAFREAHIFWEKSGVCILKTVDGHGGNEVAELFCPEEGTGKGQESAWSRLLDTLHAFWDKDCILQEKIESDSKDVRVYILGNQIYEAILRQGRQDFRSNFSLGGTAQKYDLSAKERAYVRQFLAAFRGETLGLAGLDFIVDRGGRLIFNELEEMVGTRMLYQSTARNVVRDYVSWMKDFLNGC